MFHEKELNSLYDRFYNFDWQNQNVYAEYLAQSFYYIRHSTKMLALAAGHTSLSEPKIFRRMVKHIGEEMNHELLCQKDLEALGFSLIDFHEAPATQSLYQSQYYKIQHQSPKAYLGYIYVLESLCCNVVPKILRDKLDPKYPKAATNFLRLHGEEDPGHLEQAKNVISNLNEQDLSEVANNMKHTIRAYEHFLDDIEPSRGCHNSGPWKISRGLNSPD